MILTFDTFLFICFSIAHLLIESKNILFYPIILSNCVYEDFSEKGDISLVILPTSSSKLFIYFFSVLTYRIRLLDLSWRVLFILLSVYFNQLLYPTILLRSSQEERSIFSKNNVVKLYPRTTLENYSAFLFIYRFNYFRRFFRELI